MSLLTERSRRSLEQVAALKAATRVKAESLVISCRQKIAPVRHYQNTALRVAVLIDTSRHHKAFAGKVNSNITITGAGLLKTIGLFIYYAESGSWINPYGMAVVAGSIFTLTSAIGTCNHIGNYLRSQTQLPDILRKQ